MPFGPATPFTEDDLLDVLTRNLDHAWIGGLLEDPSSRSLFVGLVAAMLRCQTSGDNNLEIGGYILTATGRAPATSTVRLTRPGGVAGVPAVALTTAVRFQDDRGMVWRPTAEYLLPAVAPAGTWTGDVPITTERFGYFLNSFEPLVYVNIDALPDSNLEILDGVDPAIGGTSDFLDLHGSERSTPRAPGESDDDYRHRMLMLVDKVSPQALAETIIEVLDAYPVSKAIADQITRDGLRALREPFWDTAQPAQRNLLGSRVAFFDDPRVFLDDHDHQIRGPDDFLGWFDVFLPTFADPDEPRMFFDLSFLDDPFLGFPDMSSNPAIDEAIAALADELDRRRAAGVRFAIYYGADQILDRHPPLGSTVQAGDWTTVGAGSEPEALESFEGDDTYVVSIVGRGNGAGLTAGDLTFELPALSSAPLAVRFVRMVARARRGTTGGAAPDLAFLIRAVGAAAPVRTITIGPVDHEDWREYSYILEQNPDTAAPWTVADVSGGPMTGGVANAAAAGPTDQLRVSELYLEIVADYG